MAWNDNLEEGTPAHSFAASDAEMIRTVAGPGSGKSFAIGRRIARLIEEGVDPEKILAITFTRTAAKDLKDDISSLDVDGSERVAARTVHSHALSILMRESVIEHTGRVPRMILDHEITPALRDLQDARFGDLRNKRALKDAYLAAWATLQTDEPGYVHDEIQEQFQEQLIAWMKRHEGMLVGEVIPVAIDYLKYNPASDAIGRFDVILVDEYQDLNKAEQQFIQLIRGEAKLVLVGDDDQSIYGFKFAHPEGIRTVEALHGEYEDIPFEECRRCPTSVTSVASSLISQNPNRTLGELVPFEGNAEGEIQIVQWINDAEEVKGITEIVKTELAKNVIEPKDVLILTQRRLIGYKLKDSLLADDVPTRSYFRESAIDKQLSQYTYSSIVLAAKPNDLVSWRYILGSGSQDFRARQYALLLEAAQEHDVTLTELLDAIVDEKVQVTNVTHIVRAYQNAVARTEEIRTALRENPDSIFDTLFVNSDEEAYELAELKAIFSTVLDEIGELKESEEDFDTWLSRLIERFQQEVANPEIPEKIDHVRIMSLHSSKGLSSKFVIVCGLADELIPGMNPTQPTVEEQRRLLYVAITRCKCDTDYEGRLILSSFISLPGKEALRLGIVPSRATGTRKVRATRFLSELGGAAPAPMPGTKLL